MRAHRPVGEQPQAAGKLAPCRDAGVLQHRMGEDQPFLLAVFADVADPAAVNGASEATVPSTEGNGSAPAAVEENGTSEVAASAEEG